MSVFTDIHELFYFAKLKIFLISASKKTNQNKKYFFLRYINLCINLIQW